MALSHCKASDGLAENKVGKAILISPVEMKVPVIGWIDMGFKGLAGVTGGTGTGITIVTGLIDVGMGGTRYWVTGG